MGLKRIRGRKIANLACDVIIGWAGEVLYIPARIVQEVGNTAFPASDIIEHDYFTDLLAKTEAKGFARKHKTSITTDYIHGGKGTYTVHTSDGRAHNFSSVTGSWFAEPDSENNRVEV